MVKGTDLGFDYMQGMPPLEEVENIEKIEPQSKTWNAFVGRILCMRPGGPFCPRFLGHYSTLLIVGKSFFVHGGIRDEQVPNGMQDLVVYNQKVSQWVKGLCQEHQAPGFVEVKQGFVWNRDYGVPSDIPCQNLAKLLGKFQCRRLMIGHTIQPAGINAVCKGKAIRIDVGMSKGCGGREPQALEVLDDERVNVLSRTGSTVLDVRADTEILKFKKSDPDNDDDDDSGASSSKPRMNLTPSKVPSLGFSWTWYSLRTSIADRIHSAHSHSPRTILTYHPSLPFVVDGITELATDVYDHVMRGLLLSIHSTVYAIMN
ncbi:hypothetical protein AXG93_4620s2080 [Marchantia polymorpha subsp. ruderalis]|uniref:Uncharacterized protein n=1 Tax=Marchantia polymorpha subsp. ruderalis TaxID=1480154 RepID=A0A176VYC4_MARPO|nr:hypothetical protein AXG93_4620s2080 [Marchantia polymorpha subsp. ruderalis]